MFGMHPNADISFAQAETYACLNTLLALQPRQVGTAAASVEEVTDRLARDMLSTIPRTFDLAVMQQKYFVEICFTVYAANDRESRFASPSSSFYFLRDRFLAIVIPPYQPNISNVHAQRDAWWLCASLPKPSILVFRLFVLRQTYLRYPVLYEESFNTVLLQEAIRYNGLLDVVKTTLVDLLKALKGLVVMSEYLEIVSNSLYTNRIPQVWQDKGYPSLKPLGNAFTVAYRTLTIRLVVRTDFPIFL